MDPGKFMGDVAGELQRLEAENKALQYKIDDLEENFNVIKHIDTRYKAQDKEISALRAEVKMLMAGLEESLWLYRNKDSACPPEREEKIYMELKDKLTATKKEKL